MWTEGMRVCTGENVLVDYSVFLKFIQEGENEDIFCMLGR